MTRKGFTGLAFEVQLGIVLAVAGIVAIVIEFRELVPPRPDAGAMPAVDLQAKMAANEAATIADIRTLIAAQAAYREANQGFYEGRLDCLAAPAYCIPSYPTNAPTFLDSAIGSQQNRAGYNRSFTPGPGPERVPANASPSSVLAYRYDATPFMIGFMGVRGFAGASDGRICFTTDGSAVPPGPGMATLPENCRQLE
jgi:hypothetical protein